VSRSGLKLRHHVGYAALRAVLGLGRMLPLRLLQSSGAALGPLAFRLARRDAVRARAHVALAFPDWSDAEREALLRASARHFGAMAGEIVWLRHAAPGEVDALVSMRGLEHLEAPVAGGRGVVLVTGHLGNWELLNARLGTAGLPITIAVREVYDARLDAVATAVRSRFGTEVVPRGVTAGRRLAAALRRCRAVGLLIDQDIRDIPGVFVPFFGHDAWTPSGAAALALRTGVPTVPGFIHRQPDGRHVITIEPPLPDPPGGEVEGRIRELTAASTAAIERAVRRHPEQWVWMHRRWRTRPEDISRG